MWVVLLAFSMNIKVATICGRARMTWRRAVEAEATAMGHSWGTLRTLAQDRLRWREFVAALVVYDRKGSK